MVRPGGRPLEAWPRQLGVVPGEADCFQHRGTADALRAAVASADQAVRCHVLVGTGGAGKTQLAAQYARASWQAGSVDLLAWVTAGSRDAVLAAYAKAGAAVTDVDPNAQEQAAQAFLIWLETTERRWLIVLDDLISPADMRGLWPPERARGQVLVTTRRRDAALATRGRQMIRVELFTQAEAAAYLTDKLAAQQRTDRAQHIAGLADKLGYLPLALAQAAAYLIDLGLDCATYQRRLTDRGRTLPDLMPDEDGLPDDHRAALAATWSLSVEQANRLRPAGLARPMLELASMLDPNGIPEVVLTSAPALAYLSQHRRSGAELSSAGRRQVTTSEASAEDAADALRCLHRLSLVDLDASGSSRMVRVHNLIQRATRESVLPGHCAALARAAADALLAAWPAMDRPPWLTQALRASAVILAGHADADLWQSGLHPVLFRAGESFAHAGLARPSITYWEDLHQTAFRRLGPGHPGTLAAQRQLAHWRGEWGDPAGAVTGFVQVLAGYLRVLGPDHADTMAARADLAYWRGQAGDPVAAVADFEQVLNDYLRVLGPDHADTMAARSDLAYWRGQAGDPAAAVADFEQVLNDYQRVLGPDHLDTLASSGNLAHWRGQAGDPAGAVAAFDQVLAAFLRVLGPDNPHTRTTRSNLAYWRRQADEADERGTG